MKIALDLDGTLITAHTRQTWLLRAVAKRYGIDLSPDYVWREKRAGKNNKTLLSQLDIPAGTIDQIANAWLMEIETSYWLSYDHLFKDVEESLSKLKTNNRLFLLTARSNKILLRQQLMRLKLLNFFEIVNCVSPRNVVKEKAQFMIENEIHIFVGDTEMDFLAAQEAKKYFMSVCTGQRSERFLRQCGVESVSSSFSAVVDKILG